jgi:hypothetical protein
MLLFHQFQFDWLLRWEHILCLLIGLCVSPMFCFDTPSSIPLYWCCCSLALDLALLRPTNSFIFVLAVDTSAYLLLFAVPLIIQILSRSTSLGAWLLPSIDSFDCAISWISCCSCSYIFVFIFDYFGFGLLLLSRFAIDSYWHTSVVSGRHYAGIFWNWFAASAVTLVN